MEPRVFVGGLTFEGILSLPLPEERHLFSSLRLREGNLVVLCDGAGREALCRLTAARTAEVLETRDAPDEPPTAVHLYPSVSKGERFEWMLQKAVELGVTSVTPVLSERCVAEAPSGGKWERLLRIVKSAAEQSGRGYLPELRKPLSFKDALRCAEGCKMFCYEDEREHSLKDAPAGSVLSVMSGPEGGYAPGEAAEAALNGWLAVSLGRFILRCETAPLMVLSAVRYGEMRKGGDV